MILGCELELALLCISSRLSCPATSNESLPISTPISATALLSLCDMACSLTLSPPGQLRLLRGWRTAGPSNSQWSWLNNAAPSLQPHYRAFITTTGCSAPASRFGTFALTVGTACGFSLSIETQVRTFHASARLRFAPPTCRMPLGQYHDIPRADPGGRVNPRF